MNVRIISKNDLPGFVAGLAEHAEVWAPVRLEGADGSRFGRVKEAKDICLDYLNTKLPVKELFFPQREVLFRFKSGDPSGVERPASGVERVVLGVRPCDAAALLLLDRVFLDADRRSFDDPYYKERREKTVLIGLACNEPGGSCFCTALAGSPHGTAGLDLLLAGLGERYFVRVLTDKGERLARGLAEAGTTEQEEAAKLAAKAAAAMSFRLKPEELRERLKQGFDHEVWSELALPCVNCGVCTYVCPTCHCFDVTDEEHKGCGARLRTWDSCQFALFTQHASGHNPRPAGRDRLRQRTLHKFRYFPVTHREVMCVGCGRCVVECPVGVDLRETLDKLARELGNA